MLLNLIRRLFGRLWTRKPYPLRTVLADKIPDDIDPGSIYLLGTTGRPWAAAFACPGGCRELIELNLLPEGNPSWRAAVHKDGTASLHPSVWRTIGCQSHFWILRGRIVRVGDLTDD